MNRDHRVLLNQRSQYGEYFRLGVKQVLAIGVGSFEFKLRWALFVADLNIRVCHCDYPDGDQGNEFKAIFCRGKRKVCVAARGKAKGCCSYFLSMVLGMAESTGVAVIA